jgi:hypothetical protein
MWPVAPYMLLCLGRKAITKTKPNYVYHHRDVQYVFSKSARILSVDLPSFYFSMIEVIAMLKETKTLIFLLLIIFSKSAWILAMALSSLHFTIIAMTKLGKKYCFLPEIPLLPRPNPLHSRPILAPHTLLPTQHPNRQYSIVRSTRHILAS